jgi:hypothetical protein
MEDQSKAKRAEELPRTAWSHNTFVPRATSFTPVKLLYDDKLLASEEVKPRSARARPEVIYNPIEVESKVLLMPNNTKAGRNLSRGNYSEPMVWIEIKPATTSKCVINPS